MALRVAFIMEQHIGHQAYYQNLRRFVGMDGKLECRWYPITYQEPHALWERIPLLPAHWRGTLSGMVQVRHALRDWDPQVTFFNTQVPAALGGGLTHQRPYVLATDITPLQYDGMAEHYGHHPDRSRLLADYKKRANQRLFQGAARLAPWSSWAADSLARDYGVDAARIETIAPGVDLEKWTPRLKPDNGVARILFVGGDFRRKGGDELLSAFNLLPKGKAELHLVTRSQVVRGEGIFVYPDMKPNDPRLVELFCTCDIFVLPTHAEAFGIAAVEASAAGLPVIATRVGGLVDIVVDGETGYLISPGDIQALADRLAMLVEDVDLRARLGLSSRKRAEARFDARKNAARLQEILLEIGYDNQ
jgi:glycosyltransferase involved in cell wall biosynthesis